jgi:hypothetical protein
MRVQSGRDPITYPTGQLVGSRKLVETGTSFYIGTKRLVKLVQYLKFVTLIEGI